MLKLLFSESLVQKLESLPPAPELLLDQGELMEINTKSKQALEEIKLTLLENYISKLNQFIEIRASYLNSKKELSDVASSLGIEFDFDIPNVP